LRGFWLPCQSSLARRHTRALNEAEIVRYDLKDTLQKFATWDELYSSEDTEYVQHAALDDLVNLHKRFSEFTSKQGCQAMMDKRYKSLVEALEELDEHPVVQQRLREMRDLIDKIVELVEKRPVA
jgi:hypothetical protein